MQSNSTAMCASPVNPGLSLNNHTRILKRVASVFFLAVSISVVPKLVLAEKETTPEKYVAFCANKQEQAQGTCVHALEIGRPHPRRIVVLVPGAYLGASTLRFIGHYISATLPDTQVWAVERREQNLEDLRHLADQAAFSNYTAGKYRQESATTVPEARNWGLGTLVADLRRIIIAAKATGSARVFLGGHSWGATTALAYAAWDFDTQPGFKDLAGLILIDGGVHDSFGGEGYKFRLTVDDATKALDKIDAGRVFPGDLNQFWQLTGAPEQVPIDYQLAGALAQASPHAPSIFQAHLPKSMQPTVALTNAALLGWLVDSHAPAGDLQAHSGHLGALGNQTQDWISDGPASIDTIARAYASASPAAFEWYWPARLTLDLEVIDPFVSSPVTAALMLPITHGSEIDRPLYTFATGITHGTVIESAKWVVAQSKIQTSVYVSDETMSHLDPLFDSPGQNKFLETVVKFLQDN